GNLMRLICINPSTRQSAKLLPQIEGLSSRFPEHWLSVTCAATALCPALGHEPHPVMLRLTAHFYAFSLNNRTFFQTRPVIPTRGRWRLGCPDQRRRIWE